MLPHCGLSEVIIDKGHATMPNRSPCDTCCLGFRTVMMLAGLGMGFPAKCHAGSNWIRLDRLDQPPPMHPIETSRRASWGCDTCFLSSAKSCLLTSRFPLGCSINASCNGLNHNKPTTVHLLFYASLVHSSSLCDLFHLVTCPSFWQPVSSICFSFPFSCFRTLLYSTNNPNH